MTTSPLETILKAKGIRPTAMRLLVLDFLQRQMAAVSLPQLENGFGPADRITLYRTLKTFVAKGLVHAIADGSGAAKYALCAEACTEEKHHDLHLHFVCTRCGETFCLPKTSVPEVTLPPQFALEELTLVAKGICAACGEKECN